MWKKVHIEVRVIAFKATEREREIDSKRERGSDREIHRDLYDLVISISVAFQILFI